MLIKSLLYCQYFEKEKRYFSTEHKTVIVFYKISLINCEIIFQDKQEINKSVIWESLILAKNKIVESGRTYKNLNENWYLCSTFPHY